MVDNLLAARGLTTDNRQSPQWKDTRRVSCHCLALLIISNLHWCSPTDWTGLLRLRPFVRGKTDRLLSPQGFIFKLFNIWNSQRKSKQLMQGLVGSEQSSVSLGSGPAERGAMRGEAGLKSCQLILTPDNLLFWPKANLPQK